MEAGPDGVRGPAATNAVVVGDPYALAPAPALHPRMVGKSVKERRTRSDPATPNPVVRQTQHVDTLIVFRLTVTLVHPIRGWMFIHSPYGWIFLSYVCVQKSAQPVVSAPGVMQRTACNIIGKCMTFCLCIVRRERLPTRPGVCVVCQPVSTALLRPPGGHRVPGPRRMSAWLSMP